MAGMPTNETLIETEHNDPAPIVEYEVHTSECTGCAQLKGDGPHTPTPAQLDLHPVHVTIGPLGVGTITVDGHDLSNRVASGGVTIQGGSNKTHTKVYLELLAGVTFDGPAEVTIIQGAHAVEFLQSVNPDHLAKAALTRGFNRNPIEVALEVLIEMAQAIETGQAPE